MFNRTELRPGYSISRVLKGHWQLADGHLIKGSVDRTQAIEDMRLFVEAGITTFDMADIYTGTEEMVGEFRARHPELPIQVHTKYVPDMNKLEILTFEDTQAIIERSLKRLGMERLDLVQFHWWDYAVPHYVDTALHLKRLQAAGKIRHIGVTNFDESHIQEILDAGVEIVSAQVQYSVMDRRPEKGFSDFCKENDIHMLCYGSLAGGFLSDRYLGQPEPSDIENRSLTKYRLIIDEIGGWDVYQGLLTTLDSIARKNNITLSEVAIAYILSRSQVAGAIVGAHNANHLARLKKLESSHLVDRDRETLDVLLQNTPNVRGALYELERYDPVHKGIMKVNLNETILKR